MTAVNNFPIIDIDNTETGCCPVFDPEPWDRKTFEMDKMLFAKASTRSIFYTPLNLGKVFTKAQENIHQAKANMESGYMILSQDVSKWKGDHYFRVEKDVPGMEMVKLSGTFMTKVYDADFSEFPKLIADLKKWIESEGYEMKEFFVFYTTCPKCAKYYGHNYMVFLGKIQ